MRRILLQPLLIAFLAGAALSDPAGPPVDSKSWDGVRTGGPARSDAVSVHLAKRAEMEAIALGWTPHPVATVTVRPSLPIGDAVAPRPRTFGTARAPDPAERAAHEARARAKLEFWALRAPAVPDGIAYPALPAKPPGFGTILPLAGDDLARSLALQRAKQPVSTRPGPVRNHP